MAFRSRVTSIVSSLALMIGSYGAASAFEAGFAGLQSGTGTFFNTPTTTPPPGLYGAITANYSRLVLSGPGSPQINGNPTHINVGSPVESLTYVPGNTIFGGAYSATIIQQETLSGAASPIGTATAGVHDTVIFPFILGYKVGDTGFFTKFVVGSTIPDGTFVGPTKLNNAGVPFVTFIPRFALAYISGGWTFNNNLVAEVNTRNPITGYLSGTTLRDEATLTRTFGRLTIGPGIFYAGQVTNDTSSKYYNFAVNTNRFTLAGVGGIVGYDFGPAALAVYGSQDLLATASGGTPKTVGGRDSAAQAGGFSVYATIAFKIPGIGKFGDPIDYSALTTAALH